jgi:hypothetical protein
MFIINYPCVLSVGDPCHNFHENCFFILEEFHEATILYEDFYLLGYNAM